MDIEKAKNILKHIAFDEYEWFIMTNKCATRISPIDANNAIEAVLAELDKQEKITQEKITNVIASCSTFMAKEFEEKVRNFFEDKVRGDRELLKKVRMKKEDAYDS